MSSLLYKLALVIRSSVGSIVSGIQLVLQSQAQQPEIIVSAYLAAGRQRIVPELSAQSVSITELR